MRKNKIRDQKIEMTYGRLWDVISDSINFGIKMDTNRFAEKTEYHMGVYINNTIARLLINDSILVSKNK